MKGNVFWPNWPAPAANDSNNPPREEQKTISRITRALIEELSIESPRGGYDPYDAHAGQRTDLWRRKPKRD